MGWGIEYNAFLSKVTEDQLDGIIEDSDKSVQHCKEKILLWCGMQLTHEQTSEFMIEFNDLWEWLMESAVMGAKAYECRESIKYNQESDDKS